MGEQESPRRTTLLVVMLGITFGLAVAGVALVSHLRIEAKAKTWGCRSNQGQIFMAMAAYAAAEGVTWPVPGPATRGTQGGDPERARSVTCRGFEILAVCQSLPASLFRCPALPRFPQPQEQPAADTRNQGRWGMGPAGFVSYACDWAAPPGAGSARPILADRQASQHGYEQTMVGFADGHVRAVAVNLVLRATSPVILVTVDCHGQELNANTDASELGEDIYSSIGDGGDPLTPGKGDPLRAWVK